MSILKLFRNLSFKRKILLYGGLVSGLSLILASGAFIIYDIISLRLALQARTHTQAALMAKSGGSAFAFQDHDFALKLLVGLKVDPHVVAACFYDVDGAIFAKFSKKIDYQFPTVLGELKHQFHDKYLDHFHPVLFENDRVGTVLIRIDLLELSDRFKSYVAIAAGVMALSLLLALMFSMWMQRFLTRPLYELERVAKLVTGQKNYSERATKYGEDELGTLTDTFNRMLGEIQNRTSALQTSEMELMKHRDHLEGLVEKRTADLLASNKELEAFAYSVSHDLRAPLRAVSGFSQMVIEDYADKLDAEGQRQLAVVRDSAEDMGLLIDGLLSFSRLGRSEMRYSNINMEELAQETFQQLQKNETSTNAKLVVKKMVQAQGDRTMLGMVLTNLLSNSIKFVKPDQSVVIEVSGKENENENIYSVKDNGVGFDMQYVDKVFQVFQRLHSAKEFEGTGIGLALVQRIITRHGGRIWAEGEIDKGTTINFAIPRHEEIKNEG